MVRAFGCGYASLVLDYPLDPLDGMNAELLCVDFLWWNYHYLEPRVNEVKCEMYLFVWKQKWKTSTSLVIRLLEDVSRVYGAHLLARIMYNTVQYWYEKHPFPTEGRVVTMDKGPFPKTTCLTLVSGGPPPRCVYSINSCQQVVNWWFLVVVAFNFRRFVR